MSVAMEQTEYLTRVLPADSQAAIAEAAALLRRGELVAFPTETVYGLGADGLNAAAVQKIFRAKGRPQDNPLILHVPSADWLARLCDPVPAAARELAARYWPGPLTMILPRRPMVPDAVTAGLDTVGVRCPAVPAVREMILSAGVPVAAPSANTSGRPSPTMAGHVLEDMQGKIPLILDGGPCSVGVESTIVDLTVSPPRLLRPGGITLEQLELILGPVAVDAAVTRAMGAGEKPRAPGMKYRHYAPRAPVTAVTGRPADSARWIAAHAAAGDGVICFAEFERDFPACAVQSLGPAADAQAHAQRVFDALRAFDETSVPQIYAQCPDPAGLDLAVVNRLQKAAGFHMINGGEQLC